MTKLTKLLLVGAVVTMQIALVGCGTVGGFGRDVTHTGHAIERAA